MSDVTDQPPEAPDRAVTRVNEITTTMLDTLGVLALAVGAGLWIAALWVPQAGVTVAGVSLLALSAAAQRRSAPREPKPATKPEPAPLPGPSDPGNVHFAGGK